MRTVLKLGGSILEPAPAPALMAAVGRAVAAGEELVIVHGGGKTLSGLLGRLGLAAAFVDGLRVTDPATLRAAVMAFAGEVNTGLVGALNAVGVPAVGLTGLDAASVRARVERPELGAVGAVTGCDPRLWLALLGAGFVPVIAPLASDAAPDAVGGPLNVNADLFAAAVAAALGADRLLFVTDVPGVLAARGEVLDARGEVLDQVSLAELDAMAASGALHGGMLPKSDACRAALAAGGATPMRVEIIGVPAACRLDAVLAGAPAGGTRVLP